MSRLSLLSNAELLIATTEARSSRLAAAPAASGGVLAIEDTRALQIIKLATEQAEHIRAPHRSPSPG